MVNNNPIVLLGKLELIFLIILNYFWKGLLIFANLGIRFIISKKKTTTFKQTAFSSYHTYAEGNIFSKEIR